MISDLSFLCTTVFFLLFLFPLRGYDDLHMASEDMTFARRKAALRCGFASLYSKKGTEKASY